MLYVNVAGVHWGSSCLIHQQCGIAASGRCINAKVAFMKNTRAVRTVHDKWDNRPIASRQGT
jgi:hypothetical protein